MKKILALICIGAILLGALSGCGIWADEEAPTETTEIVYTE